MSDTSDVLVCSPVIAGLRSVASTEGRWQMALAASYMTFKTILRIIRRWKRGRILITVRIKIKVKIRLSITRKNHHKVFFRHLVLSPFRSCVWGSSPRTDRRSSRWWTPYPPAAGRRCSGWADTWLKGSEENLGRKQEKGGEGRREEERQVRGDVDDLCRSTIRSPRSAVYGVQYIVYGLQYTVHGP